MRKTPDGNKSKATSPEKHAVDGVEPRELELTDSELEAIAGGRGGNGIYYATGYSKMKTVR